MPAPCENGGPAQSIRVRDWVRAVRKSIALSSKILTAVSGEFTVVLLDSVRGVLKRLSLFVGHRLPCEFVVMLLNELVLNDLHQIIRGEGKAHVLTLQRNVVLLGTILNYTSLVQLYGSV